MTKWGKCQNELKDNHFANLSEPSMHEVRLKVSNTIAIMIDILRFANTCNSRCAPTFRYIGPVALFERFITDLTQDLLMVA